MQNGGCSLESCEGNIGVENKTAETQYPAISYLHGNVHVVENCDWEMGSRALRMHRIKRERSRK
jgi:hypothetical protein